MSGDSPQIAELISTPLRRQIFKIIKAKPKDFTFNELYAELSTRKIEVSIASVKNLLIALCHRGYLRENMVKETKSRGRSTIHYMKKK